MIGKKKRRKKERRDKQTNKQVNKQGEIIKVQWNKKVDKSERKKRNELKRDYF